MATKKPINCAYCGAKADIVQNTFRLYQCRCTGCGTFGRLALYKPDAVTYWNQEHRPEPETLPENVGFVSISADEYKEYQRLKEAAKPMTVDEMREYCVKWCKSNEESLDSPNWCSAKPQHPEKHQCWYICSTFFSAKDSNDGQVRLVYAIIRAIERGELGGQNG